MAADNVSLGRFQLVGIPPAPRGVPQIEVTFDIDANGILNVSAKDLATGKEQKITITAPHKLSEEEIKKKIEEAQKYAEEDKKRREEAELRNEADSLIYTSEKTIQELGDKVPSDVKERVEKAVNALKESLKGKDIADIKSKIEELRKAVQEIGTRVYQQAQAQAGSDSKKDEEGKEKEKVVDADYEVVDKDKK